TPVKAVRPVHGFISVLLQPGPMPSVPPSVVAGMPASPWLSVPPVAAVLLAPASALEAPPLFVVPPVLGAPASPEAGDRSQVPTAVQISPLAQCASVMQSTHTPASPQSWSVARQSLSDRHSAWQQIGR